MTRMQPTLYRIAAILTIGAIALGTLAVVGCGGGGGEDGGTFGAVYGTVKDSDGNPLEGARVSCGGSSTTTDASGRFTIDNARSGEQTVSATMNGYFDAGDGRKNVSVPPGGSVSAGELRLIQMTGSHQYIYLSDMSATAQEDTWDVDERTVYLGGSEYLAGWTWEVDPSRFGPFSGFRRYSLARKYTRIEGTVGVDERNQCADTLVIVSVWADGDEIWRSPQMKISDAATLDLDLTDVSLLELHWDHVTTSPGCYGLVIGWADLRLKVAN